MVWQHGSAYVSIPKHVAKGWTRNTVRYVEIEVTGDQVTIRPFRGHEFLESHHHEGGGRPADGLS